MAPRRKRAPKPADGGATKVAASNGSTPQGQSEPQNSSAPGTAAWQLTWPGIATAVLLAGVFAWSYWPVCVELIHAWNTEPDYSHGWFVVPLVFYILWTRRATMPRLSPGFSWAGALLLAASLAVRIIGSACYIDSAEAWSIPLWVAASFCLLGGPRMFWWSLPATAFLIFMIPLPFHAEHLLSRPLQSVATTASCWLLQCLAQPAVQEGNVVLIGDIRLNIVEACSGLRIFMSIVALAYLYCALIKKPWWTKCTLFAAVLPIAVAANALRITLTGLLHKIVSSDAAHRFSHDLAGWLMLPIAGLMLAFVLWYIDRLIQEVETVSARDLLRSGPPKMA